MLGLDEGAPDIMVANQALAIVDLALRRIADGRRHARVRHGHDDVSLSGMLKGQALAHLVTRLVDGLAVDQRIGSRKIDVLEDTHRVLMFGQRMRRVQPLLIDHNHLARLNVAYVASVDQIKRAGFRCNHPSLAQAS